ncbi:ATP-binding protein [Streptomyces longisporoflavus]|uniref:ATP-binding protein n=1 Tax=Streptomyces longisporoflavus TaxID=28044 RepID=UPI00167DADAE|nr:ATP-binding protein [Streptomyces longisporoflavus]GGV62948.1 ATP-binding protein [Streptomyces longisporoflavus]
MELLLDTRDRDASVRSRSRSVGGQLDMSFDVRAADLGTIRDVLQAHLCWWRIDDATTDRMLIVVNELLTNVLQHTPADADGCRMASLLLQEVPDGVTAVVRDPDPHLPVYATPDSLAEAGRGLMILQALADDTSVSVTAAGKDVWVFMGKRDATEPF